VKASIKYTNILQHPFPLFRNWKDWVKSFINTQPDFRLFQNEFVKDCLNFHDTIPYGFRDLGIPEEWLSGVAALNKEFDFIYTGDVSASRNIKDIFNLFTERLKEQSLLVLSHRYEELKEQYKDYRNIIFKGPVQKDQVREYLLKSRFALNYIPDIAPFNEQTSTKLLEYIACKIPVISTKYKWMNEFEEENGGQYYYLDNNLENFNWEAINNFSYSFPDLIWLDLGETNQEIGCAGVFNSNFSRIEILSSECVSSEWRVRL
jgi:glycosyltransferase involved in cell wall biosynthesis